MLPLALGVVALGILWWGWKNWSRLESVDKQQNKLDDLKVEEKALDLEEKADKMSKSINKRKARLNNRRNSSED